MCAAAINPVELYRSLADQTRLRCLLLIEQETELCVCELTEALQLSQPKISRHLARLREDGLLLDRRQGQWVFYQLEPDLPDWVHRILLETRAADTGLFDNDLHRLLRMGNRPERSARCC